MRKPRIRNTERTCRTPQHNPVCLNCKVRCKSGASHTTGRRGTTWHSTGRSCNRSAVHLCSFAVQVRLKLTFHEKFPLLFVFSTATSDRKKNQQKNKQTQTLKERMDLCLETPVEIILDCMLLFFSGPVPMDRRVTT